MTLPLPISPAAALSGIIDPALALLPAPLAGLDARIMLLAIALQESGLAERRQVGGPARGLWQFELGGVLGVLHHPASAAMAAQWCAARGVPATSQGVYAGLASDDRLACGFARLLLWTDRAPLPGDTDAGWACYLRTWRPGRPRPEAWPAHYAKALHAVRSSS